MTFPVSGTGENARVAYSSEDDKPSKNNSSSLPGSSKVQTTGSLSQLASLPLEITRKIASHAAPRSVVSLARTNRNLHFQLRSELPAAKRAVMSEEMAALQQHMATTMPMLESQRAQESVARQMQQAVENVRRSAAEDLRRAAGEN